MAGGGAPRWHCQVRSQHATDRGGVNAAGRMEGPGLPKRRAVCLVRVVWCDFGARLLQVMIDAGGFRSAPRSRPRPLRAAFFPARLLLDGSHSTHRESLRLDEGRKLSRQCDREHGRHDETEVTGHLGYQARDSHGRAGPRAELRSCAHRGHDARRGAVVLQAGCARGDLADQPPPAAALYGGGVTRV